jgi:glycosyl transferase family 25
MTVPVFVIAMTTSTERRKTMTQRLEHLGLAFQFIDGIDGTSLPAVDIARHTSPRRQQHLAHPISTGAVGCALSHMKAWQAITDSNAPMGLILEDDARPDDDLAAVLSRLERLDGKIDIVNLYLHPNPVLVDIAKLSHDHDLTSYRYNGRGTVGYVISRAAAKHLLASAKPIVYEIDLFLNRWWDHGLHVLAVNPPLIREDDSTSTIGYPPMVQSWPNDNIYHHFRRRLNRITDSITKRQAYSSVVAAMKIRLMGLDPEQHRNNLEFPNLIKMTDNE